MLVAKPTFQLETVQRATCLIQNLIIFNKSTNTFFSHLFTQSWIVAVVVAKHTFQLGKVLYKIFLYLTNISFIAQLHILAHHCCTFFPHLFTQRWIVAVVVAKHTFQLGKVLYKIFLYLTNISFIAQLHILAHHCCTFFPHLFTQRWIVAVVVAKHTFQLGKVLDKIFLYLTNISFIAQLHILAHHCCTFSFS